MIKFIRALAACLYLLSAIPAQASFLINSYTGGGVPTSGTTSIAFQACTSSTSDLTTYTYSSAAVGTADTARVILVAVLGEDDAFDFSVSSLTVGGNSATSVASINATSTTAGGALYRIADASALTTQDIVVTYSEAVTSSVICVWAANNIATGSGEVLARGESRFSSTFANFNNVVELVYTASAVGVNMCIKASATESYTTTWDDATENVDTNNGEVGYAAWTAGPTLAKDSSIRCIITTGETIVGVLGVFASSLTAAPSITFVGCSALDTNLTTYSFTGVGIGTAGANRALIIGTVGEDNATTFSVNGVDVDANTVTNIIDDNENLLTNTSLHLQPWPTGTTATIAVEYFEAITGSAVCVWAVYDLFSMGTTAIDGSHTTSASFTMTLTGLNNGLVVAMCGSQDIGVTTTWGVLTEQVDAVSAEFAYSGAHLANTTETSYATTCDYSGTGDASGVAAVFR